MEILQFLKELKTQGVELGLKDGNLEVAFDGDALSPEIIASIRDKKEDIIRFFNKIEAGKTKTKEIPVLGIQDNYALSSTQKRLWILSKFEEANIAYNMQGAYEFNGKLNVTALEKAFEALIERHEILRTVFREDESGEPMQHILPLNQLGFQIEKIDLFTSNNAVVEMQAEVQKAAMEPFDLSEGPLLRVRLYELGENNQRLTYTLHHIVADGWSMKLMINEILALYDAFNREVKNPLPALKLQYKDYAQWQQDQLSGEKLEAHKSFWKDAFSGELPVMELSGDFQRPPVKTYNGRTTSRKFDSDLLAQVKDLCKDEEGTLFMFLLSAVKVLLYRYSGQNDVIVGTPVAGRDHTDLEEQLGLYLNTLAIRTGFDQQSSFREVFKAVKDSTLGAFEHQVYPFDELLELIKPKVDLSRSPLFDVMIALQNTDMAIQSAEGQPEEEEETAELSINRLNLVETTVSKFDLFFDFTEFGDELGVTLEYNTDIYSDSFATGVLDCLEELVKSACVDTDQTISTITILNQDEQTKILKEFNSTERDYPEQKTVLDLFRERVVQNPSKIAVRSGGKKLSYKELEEQSNAMANFLLEKGLQKSDFVGINLNRSTDLVIAILGTLIAGGAYIPIDPEYPESRVQYMIDDSTCTLIINPELIAEFKGKTPELSVEAPGVEVTPADLMYMIYTSGSTGNPKGVLLGHKTVMNLMYAVQDRMPVSEESVLLSLTTVSFDIFVTELYLPLVTGMTLVLGDEEAQRSISETKKLVFENEVTCLQMTPSRLSLLLEENVGDLFKGIDNVIAIGEVFSDQLFRRLSEVYTGRVINAYGPTETCVYSTMKELVVGEEVNIGTPLNNTQIYILSEKNQLQPIGVPGEICIAGDGLAEGYWNNEKVTTEKFIPNPFAESGRIYRTGDVGKWLSDGSIQFVGRKDNQIKLRGYRIELDEIRNQIISFNNVNAAAVTVWTSGVGDDTLVAYFTAENQVNLQEMKSYLAEQLPNYMIPGLFVQLDELPMTPNGKIDSKSLSHPEGLTIGSENKYVAPENETQEKLAAIWQEILGIEEVGILDNFFDLGGNSIRLIKMVDRISKEFGQKVSYINAFKYPNIEAFSEFLLEDLQEKFEDFDKRVESAVDVMDETFDILNNLEE